MSDHSRLELEAKTKNELIDIILSIETQINLIKERTALGSSPDLSETWTDALPLSAASSSSSVILINDKDVTHNDETTADYRLSKAPPTQIKEEQDFICAICNSPFSGIRYKCLTCREFVVCRECEFVLSAHHDASHMFVRLPPIFTGKTCLINLNELFPWFK